MTVNLSDPSAEKSTVTPLCPVFGTCGGCAYQDISYEEELRVKLVKLKEQFAALELPEEVFSEVESSPEPYYYRHRLDITMKRRREEGILMGFQLANTKRMIEIDACPIGMQAVSDYLPQLKKEALEKFTEKYKTANLVIKTGDDGRVVWGGIGRRSLQMQPEDYLWTEIHGKRIYYSLDTFFQANLSILPKLMNVVETLAEFTKEMIFFDLYGGVGLFGIYFADKVSQVISIEESTTSSAVAKHNMHYHQLKSFEIYESKVEDVFPTLMKVYDFQRRVAMVDPPRKGLSETAIKTLTEAKGLTRLLYLSCSPESLARDLKVFIEKGWKVKQVVPFDFFPKTSHLETLVSLEP